MNEGNRESLTSLLGFLFFSAGCAVGLGKVWRFPYIVGEGGGALFVLMYIVFLVMFGLPMMVAEFSVGRAAQRSLATAYPLLTPRPGPFRAISKVQVAGNWLLMMYYTTVAGWMLAYPVAILCGWFDFADPEGFYAAFVGNATAQVFWMAVVCLIGFGVCALGLEKGVEDVSKKMMAALFLLLVGLAAYALTLDGSAEGLRFYLMPSLEPLKERPLFDIVFDALGQSFFTLSLGIGSMAIFGSYTSRRYTLPGESAKIIGIDTSVALLSGLIIFPACFAYGVRPGQGPALIFNTLPLVFRQMPGGTWIGAAFFVLLALAALTTVIAVFENIIAMTMEARQCTRHKAIRRNAPLLFLLSLPCALGFNLLSGVVPLGEGSTIMDLEDFLVSNVALPLGSLAILIFCVSRRYWGWGNFLREANAGSGLRFPNALRLYMAYILPTILVLVFLTGLAVKFWPKDPPPEPAPTAAPAEPAPGA